MSWFSRNTKTIEAASAIVTAVVALAALVGIKVQLDAADTIQRAQSAREAYRSHLALAASMPDFALPADACKLMEGEKAGAYAAFVDHLLYSAEQMLDVEPGWEATFSSALEPHASYLCSPEGSEGSILDDSGPMSRVRQALCKTAKACS